MNDLYTRTEVPILAYKDTAEFLALVALIEETEEAEASELDFNTED